MRNLLVASVTVPLLLFAALAWHQRENRLREGVALAEQTAKVIVEHAMRVFEAQELVIDRVDQYIAGLSWDQIRDSEDVHRFLRAAAGSSPHVDGLWLVPSTGHTAASADFFPMPDVTTLDRDYFQVLSREDTLHFGEMIVGRTKGNLNFNLSRRRTPRETFDGLILVTASLEYFTDFWSSLVRYEGTTAGIYRVDGKILARHPVIEGLPGLLPAESLILAEMRARQQGSFRTVSPLDGVRRVYGFARIGDTPLIVNFGIDEADILADWRRDVVLQGLIALVAAGLLAGAVGTVFRQSYELAATARRWEHSAIQLREEVDRRLRAEDVAAEKDLLLAQIRDAQQQRQAILDNMIEGVAAFDARCRMVYCNQAARDMLETRDADIGAALSAPNLRTAEGLPVAPDEAPVARLLAGEVLKALELRVRRCSRNEAVCRFLGAPVHDKSGAITGAVLTFRDITRQKADEERRSILAREIDHRVRNMLATIMAIIRMTDSGTETREEFVASLRGRVQAMARAHAMLSETGWAGVSLRQIVDNETAPYATGHRIAIEGKDDLILAPKEAVDLAMVLHELATNAVKHGALAGSNGRVVIDWHQMSPTLLAISWVEQGGPAIASGARRNGFGSTLISSAFRETEGGVDLRFEPTGLVCDLRVPLRDSGSAFLAPAALAAPPGTMSGESNLRDLRILVVEDEALVRLDVVETLREAGAALVDAAATVEMARDLASHADYDAALLDVNVGGSSVAPVAELLLKKGVPVVFATGYQTLDDLPAGLRHLPHVTKPIDSRALVRAISAAWADQASKA